MEHREAQTVLANDGRRLQGYAVVWNSRSLDLGGFVEEVAPYCFVSMDGGDVRCLFNHDPNKVLGRTKSGTLRLAQDAYGLRFEVDLPETSYASDLVDSIRRGDISQCSFGFKTVKDKWSKLPDGTRLRTLQEARLLDVSVVTQPAYEQTSVAVRSRAFREIMQEPAGVSYRGLTRTEIQRRRLAAVLAEYDAHPAPRGHHVESVQSFDDVPTRGAGILPLNYWRRQ